MSGSWLIEYMCVVRLLMLFHYAFIDYCKLGRLGHDTDVISSCFTCYIVI
jgi:hypothetical protein